MRYINGVIICSFLILSAEEIVGESSERALFEDPIVLVANIGWLKGSTASTKWTNQTYYQFLGIPYAEAPSGARRFKPPVPNKPWFGMRNAIEMGQNCVEGGSYQPPTETKLPKDIEDCLNLNIFTPALPSNHHTNFPNFPVLFYIHGGSFSSGSNAEFPASYILEHNIVLVVPNYRLDALGFLSTKTTDIPGNAGMLDVLLALKWVKKYIKYFGGNPNKITVVGQSSGGAMASSLLISPLVPPHLFQQMIIHSGSIFAPWSCSLDPVANARDIARRANATKINATIHEINDALMEMNVYDLMRATNEHYKAGIVRGVNTVGGRSLTVGGPSNYLPHKPKELLQMGFYKRDVRLLAGVVKNEGSFITARLYIGLKKLFGWTNLLNNSWFLKNFFVVFAVTVLGVQDRWNEVLNFANDIFWWQNEQADVKFADYAEGFSELSGTIAMKEPILQLARANRKFSPSNPTFLYTFDYEGAYSSFGFGADVTQFPFKGGVAHGNELLYLFPYPPQAADLSANDTEVAKNLVDLWTSFVINGKPRLNANKQFVWPPMTTNSGPYLHINKEFRIDNDFTDEFTNEFTNESD